MGTTRLLGVRGALAAALLLAAVMLMLAAASADAAFPGEDGKIAFNKEYLKAGTSGIYTMAPEGGGQQRIGPKHGFSPSWSPDGKRVVFAAFDDRSEEEFAQDIYVMNANGTGVKPVTTSRRAYEFSPAFLPDGETVAFGRYSEKDNSSDIYTKKIGEPGLTRLTESPRAFEESLSVSRDGKIAFDKYSGRNGADIFIMDADGSNPENLTDTRRVEEFGADWSPDGQKVAFTSVRFSGREGPAARAASAQEEGTFVPEVLTPESLAPESLAPESLAPESLAREASAAKETTAEPMEDVEISVINADGSGRKDLTMGRAYDILPAFSPTGDEIVYSRVSFNQRSERSELVVMDSTGANKTQITDTPRAFEYEADWQPLPTATP